MKLETPPPRTRLGATFHRTLSFRRNQIQALLRVIYEAKTNSVSSDWRQLLRENSSIGTRQLEAIPRYAYGSGLVDEKYNLTDFGNFIVKYDPLLETPATLWLIHYYLSASNGLGPTYWHDIVATRFRTGDIISKEALIEQIAGNIQKTEGRNIDGKHLQACANIFLNVYAETDGLQNLGILSEIEYKKLYQVLTPSPPPLWAFAVALLDYWRYQFPNQLTINLENLYADGGLTSIFMIGSGRINNYLRLLQEEGFVDVYRVAPPYQVVLLNSDISQALLNLYTRNDDSD